MTVSKRLMDVILALLLVPIVAPLMAVIAGIVLLREGRPVLYVSERMAGLDRPFNLIKFRTMRPRRGRTGVTGGNKTSEITPTGRWLRKTRLDELPQIWNVVRGDISFVGPRPPLRLYVDAAPDLYRRVLACRPGITGLATLKYHRHEAILLARCLTSAETHAVYLRRCVPQKARIDLIYERNRSICYDLLILLHTFWAVLKR